jgi:aminoglycoside phosphotransferase (APT) family kinase protein
LQNDDPTAYYAAYDVAKRKHLTDLLAKIDVKALEHAASEARGGVGCRITAFPDDTDPSSLADRVSRQCGGQNCHLDVEFSDGVTWLARIRLDDPLLPPREVQAHIFLSEVATLQFLENTAIPAPRVHAYQLESPENAVGTSYVLMEKLSGKPLDWNSAPADGRVRVLEQLADLYLELEKHPIPLTGSLLPTSESGGTNGGFNVAGFAQMPCFETPELPLGPFKTLEESYSSIIRQQQEMFANQEVGNLRLDNYLAFLWRLEALPELVANSASRSGPFYLKHYDDKGDHLLVDEDYNITGVIDWEFASAEAKELAFSSPCMVWPVGDFYDGSNALNEDEEKFAAIFERRGRADMAAIVRGGRRWQRYLFFLGGGIPRDMTEFEPLFQGLRKSVLNEREQPVVSSYQEWKKWALAEFSKGDLRLQALMRDERAEGRKMSGP